MIASKPFYWLECDESGCDETSPGEDDETTAWGDADFAVTVAQEGEWLIVGSKHFCPDHRDPHEKERPIDGQEPLLAEEATDSTDAAAACTCTNFCSDDYALIDCAYCKSTDVYDPCPVVGFGCGNGCDCCTPEQQKAAGS